ncbi:mitotic spindle assembly checkpoint protein-like protein MAD1 [Polyplosphaeria fusca]|uniref:Spindle assembly checkpoint component MAD1 n=1 Tax=Polyplosphaeria fusca TaxID=682080 RepID=A0A9P4R530_9PLEO|nr:mitotic spindle assembly checkpoint protein-like protein MAD1 [Polyplosphaeria fusca]
MAAPRHHNQPSFNLFSGSESPPPKAQEPLRETFRTTLRTSQNASHTVKPSDPVNEDLRAQLNSLRYDLDIAKQDKEMLVLQHQQELRDLQSKADAESKDAEQAKTTNHLAEQKYESLQRELSEAQTRSTNERHALEQKLRRSQEKAQALQEDLDDVNERFNGLDRETKRKLDVLSTDNQTLKSSLDEMRADFDVNVNALQTAQRNLLQREADVRELESQTLKLKALSGDAETLAVIRRELSEQVSHIKMLEILTRDQNAELKQYRKEYKSIGVLEEEKQALESKVQILEDLQVQLREAEIRKQALEDEKSAWSSYLESESSSQADFHFDTPEDLARAFVRERLERADLLVQLGEMKPELSIRETTIQSLEDDKAKLQTEIQQLKMSSNEAVPNTNDTKVRARLERQKVLLAKEVDLLRAQAKAFDEEQADMAPEKYDESKSHRLKELEDLVDEYRKEIDVLQKESLSVDRPLNIAAGQKRSLDTEDADERINDLRRKNRLLQDQTIELQKRVKVLGSEHKAQESQLRKLKAASRTRVLELKSNPTSDAEALKLSTVRTLREANAELLARLEGATSSSTSTPLATLNAARDELAEMTATLASNEKKIKRLKQIWSAKSLEFREAVASILGWKLDFLPNGRVRVTSMFYPGDEDSGENSIIFDGENGTMKVSGGEQSAFANEIRDLITFWVEGRKDIPCFLAAMTLEFYERSTRAAR